VDVFVMRTERLERTERFISGMAYQLTSTGASSMKPLDPDLDAATIVSAFVLLDSRHAMVPYPKGGKSMSRGGISTASLP
jgi:hypothetical protein